MELIDLTTKLAAKTKDDLADYSDMENCQVKVIEQDDLSGL